ncbi:hypothetical protein ZWY2020_004627, partial [Hordeum vulgare]
GTARTTGWEKFKLIRANEDATVLDALSLSTPKIRLLRSLTVKKNSIQCYRVHHDQHSVAKIHK